jgi:cytochrome P450
VIPSGTQICVASIGPSFDADIYPEPEKFDGARYFKMPQDEMKDKRAFTATGTEDLPFGYGKHVCPGRIFTEVAIKMILSEILDRYDIEFSKGEKRPSNIQYDEWNIPGEIQVSMQARVTIV